MMGEQDALVLEVRDVPIHGVAYVDVKVAFRDRSVHEARLGAESVPQGLHPGERVLATQVANMIVSLRRPDPMTGGS
jgi:hypothetical protein